MIIDAVKNYFEDKCYLLNGKRLNVNYLGEKPFSYTVVPKPSGIIRQYPDGGSLREYTFVFAAREYFDCSAELNLQAAQFFEKFALWIEEQNEGGILPILGDGLCPVKFEIISSGYLYDAEGKTARYHIKLKLIYEKF